MMKALVLNGTQEDLQLEDALIPTRLSGQTLVRVRAAALNHRDVWIQRGLYAGPKYPIILGSDGAGTTEDGRSVIINPSVNWGDEPRFQGPDYQILGLPENGTFAEYIVIPSENLVDMPAHLSFEQAAALPLAGLTAYRALFTRGQLRAGERVLVSGIGGGVALFALQFALAAGAEVWVTSSAEEKIERAKSLGAKGGFDYRVAGWSKTALAETGGFDVVIDGASGPGFGELVKACRPGARVSVYGGTAGVMDGISPPVLFFKQLTIAGTTMGNATEFGEMVAFVEQHQIIPVVDEVVELEAGNLAMQKMAAGRQFGKLVLRVS